MGRLAGGKGQTKAPIAPQGGPKERLPRFSHESGKQALLGKITALLADRKLPTQYAHGMAQKMFKVSCIQWCNPDQLWRIVAALEIQKRRLIKKAAQAASERVKEG